MGSIHAKIVVKNQRMKLGKIRVEEVVMTKAEYLRLHSKIAKQSSDKDMQEFFDAFRI